MRAQSAQILTKYQTEQKLFARYPISSEVLLKILENSNELPLGFESHPWRILIIDNEKQKRKLSLATGNDLMGSSPIVLIFVADTRVWSAEFSRFLKNYPKLKSITQTKAESLSPISYGLPGGLSLVENVKELVNSFRSTSKPWWQLNYSDQQICEIVCAQARLAAANFMIESKLEDIESVIIEDFDYKKVSSFLKLAPTIKVAAIVCAGYPLTQEN